MTIASAGPAGSALPVLPGYTFVGRFRLLGDDRKNEDRNDDRRNDDKKNSLLIDVYRRN
jgi:hypothetical protein